MILSIWGYIGEYCVTFLVNYREHRARCKRRLRLASDDDRLIATKDSIEKGLGDCVPDSDHIANVGKRQLCKALKNDDHFGSMLAIDANPGPRKRDVCIVILKLACAYICKEDAVDAIRGATFTYLACNK